MSKWDSIKTKHGFKADQVISALQKEIRRGKEEEAMFWTYELCVSSEELTKKLWERLVTISVEDIGFANEGAVTLISTLKREFYDSFEKLGDQLLMPLYATSYLARSHKDRYIDEAKHYIRDHAEKGNFPEIPDYAIDQHTLEGKEKGRGFRHFLREGAKLEPISMRRNRRYVSHIAKREGVEESDIS